MSGVPVVPLEAPPRPRRALLDKAKAARWWVLAIASLVSFGWYARARIAEFATIRQVLAIEHAVKEEHDARAAKEAHYDAVGERDAIEHRAILRELGELHEDVRTILQQAISIKRAVKER